MNRSEEIKQLAIALSKAQSIMKTAKKDSENPFFKSTYADLASVWEAIRTPFTENGFSISQFTETKDDRVCVTTLLLHTSGEWLSSELVLPTLKLDPQAFGSAITYARRYALAAICGVASDDDDAEESMKRKEQHEKSDTISDESLISEAQAKRFYAIAKGSGYTDEEIKEWLMNSYAIDSSKKIPKSKYEEICKIVGVKK